MKVKICGVRRVEDALVAAEAGVDFMGLVFVPNRRRRISVEQARRIVDAVKASSDNPPKLAGLFADQPIEEVREKVRAAGVDMVQLCGSESMEYCDEAPVPVIRITHVPAGLLCDEELQNLERRLAALARAGPRGDPGSIGRGIAGRNGAVLRLGRRVAAFQGGV